MKLKMVLMLVTRKGRAQWRKARALARVAQSLNSGNAEASTQRLVDLMDAFLDGGDSMWRGRTIAWLSSLMPALHELRDKGHLHLQVGLIRETAPPLKYFELLESPALSDPSRDAMWAFLWTVPGFNPAKKPQQQSSSFLDHFCFVTMRFTDIVDGEYRIAGVNDTPAGAGI